ncbi:DUF6192 family protein [Streptomyces mirabilis]|uniref:DUF6192 family protein n=1 Tax=Streptomyces mirabilis TaxID=68239 RepID=UPI0036DB705D
MHRQARTGPSLDRVVASISEKAEQWAQIEDQPFNQRTDDQRWRVKRLVGQCVYRPAGVEGYS